MASQTLAGADATIDAFINIWTNFIEFIPQLIIAILVFVVFWIIAIAAGKVVARVLTLVKVNDLFEKTGWQGAFEKAKLKVNPSEFLGVIVKWILIITGLRVAVDVLGPRLDGFTVFLDKVIDYLPHLLVAALIFVVVVILADIAEKIVVATVEKMKVAYSHVAGEIVKWAIWITGIGAILIELQVATPIVEIFYQGLVAVFVIVLGLAFGLGGKDVAADILRDLRGRIKGA